jgi:hypothetical protein
MLDLFEEQLGARRARGIRARNPRARMPARHLLDILKNVEHWARFTRHFGPPSGSPPSFRKPFGATCSLCSATAAILARTRRRAMLPRSPRHGRCAGSTRNTSTPTRWKPPSSTWSIIRPLPATPELGQPQAGHRRGTSRSPESQLSILEGDERPPRCRGPSFVPRERASCDHGHDIAGCSLLTEVHGQILVD